MHHCTITPCLALPPASPMAADGFEATLGCEFWTLSPGTLRDRGGIAPCFACVVCLAMYSRRPLDDDGEASTDSDPTDIVSEPGQDVEPDLEFATDPTADSAPVTDREVSER